MRKFLVSFLFVLLCCSCSYAQGANQIMLYDGTIVGATNPLPMSGTSTVGTVTVNIGAPPDENSTTVLSATVTAQDVTSLANRNSINFFNHSDSVTCWISLDSATASAAANVGIPLFPYGFAGFELDSSKVASVYAAGVASVTVYQDGY